MCESYMPKEILFNILKTRSYICILIVVSLILGLSSVSFKTLIIPSFKEQVINNIIDEANRVSSHLKASIDFKSKNLSEINQQVKTEMDEFQIYKIHYYDRNGRNIYSSNNAQMGKINTHGYFTDIVAKGEVYFKIKQAGEKSLEGELVFRDIIEIYLPIMQSNIFLGAFELYYDISQELYEFNLVAASLTRISLFVFSSAFALMLVFLYFASKNNLQIKNYQFELRSLAELDHLTQIYNRRFFYEHASLMLLEHGRSRKNISICMIDIDNFKEINDTYGHKAGDLVIKNVCTTIKSLTRQSDIVARYGGEEFIILLPNTTIIDAAHLSNNICNRIAELEISIEQHSITLTVSIGISQYDAPQDLESFIHNADTALYSAKRTGKDRVSLFSNPALNV